MSEQALPAGADETQTWLERHARRRTGGVPTVTVLSGPGGLGIRAWRRWAASEQRPVVQQAATEPAAVATCWAAAVARQRDLTADALTLLAARAGRTPEDLRASWTGITLHDLERFAEGAALDRGRDPAAAVSHWLAQRWLTGRHPDPNQLAGQLDALLAPFDGPGLRVVAALASLLSPDAVPALLLVPPSLPREQAAWLHAAARIAASFAERVPALPVALAPDPEALAVYLRTAPESHAHALVREGIVPVAHLTEDAVARRLKDLGLAGDLAGTVTRLAGGGASEELVRTLGDAAQAAGAKDADQARSAAERFLFELLESRAETTGLFALNGALDFRFGNRDAEVDLLARDLRLAVELDGYYHFQERDGYRRDRRKDWELQRRGYLVLRFLAEDVVARMEEILDTVRQAVEHCREQRQPGRAMER
jgi:very-short-patch-repair endonuclease